MKFIFYLLLALALVVPEILAVEDGEVEKDAEVTVEEDTKSQSDKKDDNTETPNTDGKKPVELEDAEMWKAVDLDGNGQLTINELERFYSSPNAQAYVRQMKAKKAVADWAAKMGIDVEKAKMAMNAGMIAERQQNWLNQQKMSRMQAFRRQQAILQRNQQINLARQQQQNYWARMGQQYYRQMQRRGGRIEL